VSPKIRIRTLRVRSSVSEGGDERRTNQNAIPTFVAANTVLQFEQAWIWLVPWLVKRGCFFVTPINKGPFCLTPEHKDLYRPSAFSTLSTQQHNYTYLFHWEYAVPLQVRRGPEDFMTTAQDGGKVVSQTHRPLFFTPRKYSWYSFLLEAESTPGAQCDRKDIMSMKNSNDTIWDRTSDLPICSTAH